MEETAVMNLVKGGETQSVEFKRDLPKDFGKTICSFNNVDGGYAIIGVDDNGKVVGLNTAKADDIQQSIFHESQQCNPSPVCDVKKVNLSDGLVLVVKVPKLGSGVCYYKSDIYVRVGTTDHRISGPSVEDFLKKRQVLSFENENSKATLQDIDRDKIKDYLSKRNPAVQFEESKIKPILQTLHVATLDGDFHLKNSALLLFAKDVTKFIPQNQVKLVRYKGRLAVDILDTKTLTGTLVENIISTIDFILRNTKKSYKIEGVEREEIEEYPRVAIREAIINAIVHKDYYSPAAIQVNIFDDRIEITNPGALPCELKIHDLPFLGLGIPRNPVIYRLLSDINIVEGLGTGFPRMFDAMRKVGLPDPRPADLGTIFKLTLYNKHMVVVEGGLNERQHRAISYIREHTIITTNKHMETHKITRPTAISDLTELVKKGILSKRGKGRSTHYVINLKAK